MKRLTDFHIHSTASDGQYSPEKIAKLVKERGVDVWSLTDHDTLDGLREAMEVSAEVGLNLIRGIELSAKEYNTFHILGYGFGKNAPALTSFCGRVKDIRDSRNIRLLAFLSCKGIILDQEEVESLAGGQIVGRPHFAQAMVTRGYVRSNREAFDRYLDTPEYHEVVSYGRPSVRECIEAILADGGVVSLAHPYQIGLDNDALDRLVGELKKVGLGAIECYYPRHTAKMMTFYLELAKKYDLYVTGGSDFHGEKVKPDIELAAYEIDVDWLTEGR